ncbi:hypothetical protein LX36DRAFT_653109 [Colletotrichum falcatum]|nr:hypothetical protein LX36DRAFT_653109 [Colletotrichum falcatum]
MTSRPPPHVLPPLFPMFLPAVSPASARPNERYHSQSSCSQRYSDTPREMDGPARSAPSLQAVSGIEQPHFCKATVKRQDDRRLFIFIFIFLISVVQSGGKQVLQPDWGGDQSRNGRRG